MLTKLHKKQKNTVLSTPHTSSLQVPSLALSPNHVSNRYITAATSDNTRKAYQADIRHYEKTWGRYLPASTEEVLTYLHAFAETLNPRTLSRRLIALKQWHKAQQLSDPTEAPMVRKTLIGIKRLHGKPKEKAAPLLPEHLIKIAEYLASQETLSAYRDSALLQLGFLGAFRRSELVTLRLEDIDWQPEGIEIQLKKSKTDQTNEGQYCVVPHGNTQLCAIRALKIWCEKSGIQEGEIFRRIYKDNKIGEKAITPESVNLILKKHAKTAGIRNPENFSSHSMRRGLATTASREGVSLPAIMRQGRWKQVSTVMEYIEAAQRFEQNAAGQVLRKIPSKLSM